MRGEARENRRRSFKKTITLLLVMVGLISLLAICVKPAVEALRGRILYALEDYLEGLTDMEVSIENISFFGFTGVRMDNLTANATHEQFPLRHVKIERTDTTYNFKSLFNKELPPIRSIEKVEVKGFEVDLNLDQSFEEQSLVFDDLQEALRYAFDIVMSSQFMGSVELNNGRLQASFMSKTICVEDVVMNAKVDDGVKITHLSGDVCGTYAELSGSMGEIKRDGNVRADISLSSPSVHLSQWADIIDPDFLVLTEGKGFSYILTDVYISLSLEDAVEVKKFNLKHEQLGRISGSGEISLDFSDKERSIGIDDFSGDVFVDQSHVHELLEEYWNADFRGDASLALTFSPKEIRLNSCRFKVNDVDVEMTAELNFGKSLSFDARSGACEIWGSGGIEGNEFEEFAVNVENVTLDILTRMGVEIDDSVKKYVDDMILSGNGVLNGRPDRLKADGILNISSEKALIAELSDVKSVALPVSLDMSSGYLEIEDVMLPTYFGDVSISGAYGYEIMELSAHMDADKVNLSKILDISNVYSNEDNARKVYSGVDGYVDVNIDLKYSFKEMGTDILSGIYAEANVTDGTVKVDVLDEVFDQIEGILVLGPETLRLEDVTAKCGGGEVKVSGIVGIRDLSQLSEKADLTVTLNGLEIDRYGVSGTLNGAVGLKGTSGTFNLDGTVYVSGLAVTIGSIQITSLGNMTSSLPEWSKLVNLNLNLISEEDIKISGNGIDLTVGSCSFSLGGTVNSPRIAGSASMKGGKARIVGTDFELIEGRILFDNSESLVPSIDVTARTRLGARDRMQIRVSGTIDDLKVESGSGNSEANDEIRDGIMKLLDSKARLYIVYDLEEELVRRGFIDDMELFVDENSAFQLQVGKTISDDLYVYYTRELDIDGDNLFSVEYKINPNLTMTGDFSDKYGSSIGFETKFVF